MPNFRSRDPLAGLSEITEDGEAENAAAEEDAKSPMLGRHFHSLGPDYRKAAEAPGFLGALANRHTRLAGRLATELFKPGLGFLLPPPALPGQHRTVRRNNGSSPLGQSMLSSTSLPCMSEHDDSSRRSLSDGCIGIYESDRVLSASSLARYDHRALSDDDDDLLGLGRRSPMCSRLRSRSTSSLPPLDDEEEGDEEEEPARRHSVTQPRLPAQAP